MLAETGVGAGAATPDVAMGSDGRIDGISQNETSPDWDIMNIAGWPWKVVVNSDMCAFVLALANPALMTRRLTSERAGRRRHKVSSQRLHDQLWPSVG